MSRITLGTAPAELRVHIAAGGTWAYGLTAADGTPWPAGAAVTLEFADGTVWTAVVTGPLIQWTQDAASVAALATAAPATAQLWYRPAAGQAVLWASGSVRFEQ